MAALERFASEVAELVKESGVARSLEPMPSADRKVIHDTLADDRRRGQPLRGRRSLPPDHRQPGVSRIGTVTSDST